MTKLLNSALNRIEEYYKYKGDIFVPSPPPRKLDPPCPSKKCQNNNALKYARLTKLINAALNRIEEYYNYKENICVPPPRLTFLFRHGPFT